MFPTRSCSGKGLILQSQIIRPRIIQYRPLRAWHRAHTGGTGFAALLDRCSQQWAELIVLLPETSHSFDAAFLKNYFGLFHLCFPVHAANSDCCSPLAKESVVRPLELGLKLPARSISSSNVGAFAVGIRRTDHLRRPRWSMNRLRAQKGTFAVAKWLCGSLIGTVRRECLDRRLIFGESHLRRSFFLCGLLQSGAHARGSGQGCAVAIPILAGLHHQYVRTYFRKGQLGRLHHQYVRI